MNVLTWKEAKNVGEVIYSGKSCLDCGSNARYTKSGSCVYCVCKKAQAATKSGYHKARYRKDPLKAKATNDNWRDNNRERVYENLKRWKANNEDKVKAIKKAYKARRRATEKAGDATRDLHKWEVSAKKVCYWCGIKCESNYHIDHYQPLTKGGTHTVDNLVIACPPCNQHKSNKDPYDFAKSKWRLF